jgi:hypothetical protein
VLSQMRLSKKKQLENKKLHDMLRYYKNRMKSLMEKRASFIATNDMTGAEVKSFESLLQRIDDAFGIMKGAHGETKVAKLFELIGAGLLLNDSGISVLESLHRDYVRNKFSAWKLVYASYMSPAGSFCTATVSGLTEFFDSPDDNEYK